MPIPDGAGDIIWYPELPNVSSNIPATIVWAAQSDYGGEQFKARGACDDSPESALEEKTGPSATVVAIIALELVKAGITGPSRRRVDCPGWQFWAWRRGGDGPLCGAIYCLGARRAA